MIATLKGDIIGSRNLKNQKKWMTPLKDLLSRWGKAPKDWELVWGDFFQVEISNPEDAIRKVFEIKALIKKVESYGGQKKSSPIDVRMAVGIGKKEYAAKKISESNGPAFVYAGEKFDLLKKEGTNIGIKTPWSDFDEEINLYLKLAGTFMDKMTILSAELIEIVLNNPQATQKEIGKQLGIKQNTVSGRWSRANVEEILLVENIFRKKIKKLLT